MSLLKIARMGNPVLMRRALRVEEPASPAIARLVGDMIETMADAGGVGLAAPQVHVGLRVVVYFVPPSRTEDGSEVPLTVLINPVIEPLGTETALDREGCLSLPGMTGVVRRPVRIRLSYQDLDGDRLEREISGYHARVVQHECDHLDGILYPMRMDDLASFGYVDEIYSQTVNTEEEEQEPAA
ncbi:MAG: peptide deformylase [Rhodospirillales bacterium]